jgi:hypothetical protein
MNFYSTPATPSHKSTNLPHLSSSSIAIFPNSCSLIFVQTPTFCIATSSCSRVDPRGDGLSTSNTKCLAQSCFFNPITFSLTPALGLSHLLFMHCKLGPIAFFKVFLESDWKRSCISLRFSACANIWLFHSPLLRFIRALQQRHQHPQARPSVLIHISLGLANVPTPVTRWTPWRAIILYMASLAAVPAFKRTVAGVV